MKIRQLHLEGLVSVELMTRDEECRGKKDKMQEVPYLLATCSPQKESTPKIKAFTHPSHLLQTVLLLSTVNGAERYTDTIQMLHSFLKPCYI